MKIFTKLLITLVIMTTILFASLYTLLRWSFDEGMLNYINQREIRGLTLLADNLIQVQQEIGDLEQLQQKPYWWHETLKASMLGQALDKEAINQIKNNIQGRKKAVKTPRFHQDSPPINRHRLSENKTNNIHERQRPPRERLPEKHTLATRRLENPLFDPKRAPSLLNTNKKPIIGRHKAEFTLLAINGPQGVIGYLALPPAQSLTSSFDLAFSQSQQKTWLIILFAVFSITFLVSVLLSRYLVKNIQTLAKATHQLNNGNFNVQLLPHGKDELATLARNFNDLAQTLSQNEISRKAWLADISHELRTPLAIVKGEIEALQDGIRPVTPDSLQSLADEINHLQKLIADLNQLSNADIGALSYQKEQHNIIALLQLNLQRHEQAIAAQGLTLSSQFSHEKILVWADSTRLHQLFDNILTNSLKYTDSPGTIAIAVTKEKKNVILTFEDSSPCVPDDAMDKLFDHLFRVESSRNRQTGGSGLGLALCKKIVTAHQGSISTYASPLGGLGLKIILPKI